MPGDRNSREAAAIIDDASTLDDYDDDGQQQLMHGQRRRLRGIYAAPDLSEQCLLVVVDTG